MRRSCARSGPTANGISVTTMRKNSTPISAPPPIRTARRMSRRSRAAEGRHALSPEAGGVLGWSKADLPSCNSLHSIPSGPWVAATIIPPPARCSAHRVRQASPGRPHRAPRSARRAARSGAAPRPAGRARGAGAGRPTDRRRAGPQRIKPDAPRAPGRRVRCCRQVMNPEFNVFPDRQRGLEGVEMAEVVRLLADGALRHAAFERDHASGRGAAGRRPAAAARTSRRRSARSAPGLRRDDNWKLRSLNTLRDPRTQPSPVAESRNISGPRRRATARRAAQANKMCGSHSFGGDSSQ